ncbi:MAG: ABC transporter permease subunit [Chloroflexota bacterium]
MASGTSTIQSSESTLPQVGLFAGRRGRILRENLTAYLFLFPATSLIFVFGIFPVAFSLYVSFYKWRIKQGDYRGLGNYVKALDNLAYVIAFGLAIGAVWLAVSLLLRIWKTSRENREFPWLFALPGAAIGLAGIIFMSFFSAVLPEILSIGDKVRNVERSNALFIRLFREAFQVETVVIAQQQMLLFLGVGIILYFVLDRFVKTKQNGQYLLWFSAIVFFGFLSYLIGILTYSGIQIAYFEAQQTGEEIAIWTQVISMGAGLLLFYLSAKLWSGASQQDGTVKTILRFLTAVALIGGAWIMIAELPAVLAAGDERLWSGLRVTAWYSFLTVPIQLSLGMVLAYLLYQNIKGKAFFRMMYFLPYITPAVAAAAVFRIIFSNRPSGMMNKAWTYFGAEPLNWLLEPQSVFDLGFITGPSLALVVIIIFNVWTYTGYNTVIFLAGLGSIPGSLYEAAQIDGANRWHVFRHITVPLLSPTTYFLSVLGVIGTFKAFNHVYIMRQASALDSVDTMSLVIWDELFTSARYGYAATLAFVLFGVVLILTLINNKVQGDRVFYG